MKIGIVISACATPHNIDQKTTLAVRVRSVEFIYLYLKYEFNWESPAGAFELNLRHMIRPTVLTIDLILYMGNSYLGSKKNCQ